MDLLNRMIRCYPLGLGLLIKARHIIVLITLITLWESGWIGVLWLAMSSLIN